MHFYFSSRRRHTRWPRDWSSDVCSSDLKSDATDEEIWAALRIAQADEFVKEKKGGLDSLISQGGTNLSGGQRRSEERRVGKERRAGKRGEPVKTRKDGYETGRRKVEH